VRRSLGLVLVAGWDPQVDRRGGLHDSAGRVAHDEHAHAAALGDVDDLGLGRAPQGREAVRAGREAVYDVEGLGVEPRPSALIVGNWHTGSGMPRWATQRSPSGARAAATSAFHSAAAVTGPTAIPVPP
jgi:hypothetical protein